MGRLGYVDASGCVVHMVAGLVGWVSAVNLICSDIALLTRLGLEAWAAVIYDIKRGVIKEFFVSRQC